MCDPNHYTLTQSDHIYPCIGVEARHNGRYRVHTMPSSLLGSLATMCYTRACDQALFYPLVTRKSVNVGTDTPWAGSKGPRPLPGLGSMPRHLNDRHPLQFLRMLDLISLSAIRASAPDYLCCLNPELKLAAKLSKGLARRRVYLLVEYVW